MKFKWILFTTLIFSGVPGYGQPDSKLFSPNGPDLFNDSIRISTIPPIRKGNIKFVDGNLIKFRNLTVRDDSVQFTDHQSIKRIYSGDKVFMLTRTGSGTGEGILIGGAGGLVFGLLTAKTLAVTADFFASVFTLGTVTDLDTKDEGTSFVLKSTLIGMGAGAIAGAFFKKNRIVYRRENVIDFHVSLGAAPGNKGAFILTCKIEI